MSDETKKCPYCGEEIRETAIKCRFCGEMLSSSPSTGEASSANPVLNGFVVSDDTMAGAWRRFLARFFDFVVFGFVPIILGGIATAAFPPLGLIIFPVVLAVAFFIETFWYAKYNNTPGKFFFGIRVVDRNGVPLSLPAYTARTWNVYLGGYWCGILSFIPWIIQYQRVESRPHREAATYDRESLYFVVRV